MAPVRVAELAEGENIAPSYLTRVLRLSLLAPDIVEAILDGKQVARMSLAALMEPFPHEREEQQTLICCPTHPAHCRHPRDDRRRSAASPKQPLTIPAAFCAASWSALRT